MKTFIFVLVCLIASISLHAQSQGSIAGNTIALSDGNFKEMPDSVSTGKYWVGNDHVKYPVFANKNGKLFIMHRSKTTGELRRYWLKIRQ